MAIDNTALDSNFKYQVASCPGAENIKACFTCGVCTAGCPVSEVEERYNPRKMIRMIVMGMKEELLSSELIWLCNSCYTCYAHCPQDVKFTDVINVLRKMAVKEGYVDASFPDEIEDVDVVLQKVRKRLVGRLYSEDVEEKELQDNGTDDIEEKVVSLLHKYLQEDKGGRRP